MAKNSDPPEKRQTYKRISQSESYSHVNIRIPDRVMELVGLFNRRPGEKGENGRRPSRSLMFQRFLKHLMATESIPDFMEKYWEVITTSAEMEYPISRLLSIRTGACPTDDELYALSVAAHFSIDKLRECRGKYFSDEQIKAVNESAEIYDFSVLSAIAGIVPKLLRAEPLDPRERVLLENLKVGVDLDTYASNCSHIGCITKKAKFERAGAGVPDDQASLEMLG